MNDSRSPDIFYLLQALTGDSHAEGVKDFLQLLFVQQFLFFHQLTDGLIGLQRGFGDIGSVLVADVRRQGSDGADTVVEQIAASFFVGSDAYDAVVHQCSDRAGECGDGFKQK